MNSNFNYAMRGSCACGTVAFRTRAPRARLICHCTICQAFTGKAFSDMAIVPEQVAELTHENRVIYKNFKKYRFPPPNLKRGRCDNCGQVALETFGFYPFRILFIPAASFKEPELLPLPEAHLFYEHRQQDAVDGLPTHEGYISSQKAIFEMIMHSI